MKKQVLGLAMVMVASASVAAPVMAADDAMEIGRASCRERV